MALGDGLPHPIGQQRPVRQARQIIVIGQVFKTSLTFLEFGDVRKHNSESHDTARDISNGRNSRMLNILGSVFAAIVKFAFPETVGVEFFAQFGVEACVQGV